MRFALAFGFLGSVLVAQAVHMTMGATGMWWLLVCVELYLATCLLSLAAAYALRAGGISVEDLQLNPAWSHAIRAVLMPYLALGVITLYMSRWFDREGLLNSVAPGLYIGRLPFPSELAGLRAAGIEAVLNLCWEFPRLSGVDTQPGMETARVPILDGSPPSDRQSREAVRCGVRWRAEGKCVLIHCAQGHGRTATITAAMLLRLGMATDIEEALVIIGAARPLARPSTEQKKALTHYALGVNKMVPGTDYK